MPYNDKDTGELKFKEVSIFDTIHNLDRGPDDEVNFSVIEIKTNQRILTLYTKEINFMSQFFLYFEKAIYFRDTINQKQKEQD